MYSIIDDVLLASYLHLEQTWANVWASRSWYLYSKEAEAAFEADVPFVMISMVASPLLVLLIPFAWKMDSNFDRYNWIIMNIG